MSGPSLAFLLVFLASFGGLAVCAITLVRGGMRLARSVKRFQSDAVPLADEIAAEANRAEQHLERLSVAAAALRARD